LRWRDAVPGISPQFADFLDRLMTRSPTQRPQTAEVILQQLAEINRSIYSSQEVSQFTPLTKPTWAKPTSYIPQPASPTAPPNNITEHSVASTPPQTASRLDPDFISRCQQELVLAFGPFVVKYFQLTLKENPGLSETEFLEAVVKRIPDPFQKKAREIQRRLLS
jgi:serine/threonine protein kinase